MEDRYSYTVICLMTTKKVVESIVGCAEPSLNPLMITAPPQGYWETREEQVRSFLTIYGARDLARSFQFAFVEGI